MKESTFQKTEISEYGEFGLIDYLSKEIVKENKFNASTIKGIGDDCAVIASSNTDNYQVVTKDLLLENIHFDLTYVPLKHLGYKAVAVNLSDIFAMNAVPKQILVGLSVSNRFSIQAVEELYRGIKLACDEFSVDIVGGDTTTSPTGLYLSITAMGEVAKNKITYRSTAKENDLLFVSGDLGAAYFGLQVLEREKEVFMVDKKTQPKLEDYSYIVSRFLKPIPRKDILDLLDSKGVIPTSMIDISDGLASEALHIARSSNVGIMLDQEKIPIDEKTNKTAEEFSISSLTTALNGGEDYELMFTVDQKDYEKIKDEKKISLVGYIQNSDKGNIIVNGNNELIPLKAQGWKHF